MSTIKKNVFATLLIGALMLAYAPPARAIPVLNIPGIPPDIASQIENTIQAVAGVASEIIDIWTQLKEKVLDPLAWVYAKTQIFTESNTILDQVRGGGNARPETNGPLFVTDWENVGTQAANNQRDSFLKELEVTNKVDPAFKQTFLDSLRNNDRRSVFSRNQSTFASDVGCNEPDNPDGSSPCLGNYLQDFSKGGWQGWNSVVEGPGNNPYFSYLSLQDEKNRREQSAAQARRDEALASGGALGTQSCTDVDSPEGGGATIKKCTITRPGSTVNADLSKVLGSNIDTLQQVDEFQELISSGFQNLIGAMRSQGVVKPDNGPDVVDVARTTLETENIDAAEKILKQLADKVNTALGNLDAIWQIKVRSLDAIDDQPPGLIYELKVTQDDVAYGNAHGIVYGGYCAHHPEVSEPLDNAVQDAKDRMQKLFQDVGYPVDFNAVYASTATPNDEDGKDPKGDFEIGGRFFQTLSQKQSDLEYLRMAIGGLSRGDDTPPTITSTGSDPDVSQIYQNPALTPQERLHAAEQLLAVEYGQVSELLQAVGDIDIAKADLSRIDQEIINARQARRGCYDHGH